MLIRTPGFTIVAFLLAGVACFAASPLIEETEERAVPMSGEGTVTVRLREGAINIYGSEGGEVKIVATKRAYSRARLDAIRINVEAQPDRVVIDTTLPDKKEWGLGDRSGTVEYYLYIPQHSNIDLAELGTGELHLEGMRGVRAHAQVGNGRLYCRNCFTDLDVRVDRGGLDVAWDWWEEHAFKLAARIAYGGIRSWIPSDASFNLAAAARDGHVNSGFTPKEERRGQVSSVAQSVGSDIAADLHFEADRGNIDITKITW